MRHYNAYGETLPGCGYNCVEDPYAIRCPRNNCSDCPSGGWSGPKYNSSLSNCCGQQDQCCQQESNCCQPPCQPSCCQPQGDCRQKCCLPMPPAAGYPGDCRRKPPCCSEPCLETDYTTPLGCRGGPDPCCYGPCFNPCTCPVPPPFYKKIFCPLVPLVPGYTGHVPGYKHHGASRTYGNATKDTVCIMNQRELCYPWLPHRIFEQ